LEGLALVAELGEARAELGSPLLVEVVVAGGVVRLQFGNCVGLLALDLSDLGFEGSPTGDGRVVTQGGLFPLGKQGVTVLAEDPPGEEGVNRGQELVFADPEALGVGGVPVAVGVVSRVGLAGVVAVDVSDVAGLAI
jgi:hypothetical protein